MRPAFCLSAVHEMNAVIHLRKSCPLVGRGIFGLKQNTAVTVSVSLVTGQGYWGPNSLPFNVYRLSFPGQSGRGVKLTIHPYTAPRLRMSGVIPLLPYMILRRGQGKDLRFIL